MRWALVFVMIMSVGCVAGEPARRHRWPDHRKDKDQKIEELLERVAKLEKELAETRAYIAKLPTATPAPPAPSPAPAPP
jgi:hypothetical protein